MLIAFLIRVLNRDSPAWAESQAVADVVKEICAGLHIDVRQGDHESSLGEITEKLLDDIRKAQIVFADANSSNENVWYEIGHADSGNQNRVICICRRGRTIPFDRRNVRSVAYQDGPWEPECRDDLRAKIIAVIKQEVFPALMGRIDNETKAADGIVQSVPAALHDVARQWLLSVTRTHDDMSARRTAVRALEQLGCLTPELCVELTGRSNPPDVRAVVYDILSDSEADVPQEVWDLTATDSALLLDSFSRAAARYWAAGKVSADVTRRWAKRGSERGLENAIRQGLSKAPVPESFLDRQ